MGEEFCGQSPREENVQHLPHVSQFQTKEKEIQVSKYCLCSLTS